MSITAVFSKRPKVSSGIGTLKSAPPVDKVPAREGHAVVHTKAARLPIKQLPNSPALRLAHAHSSQHRKRRPIKKTIKNASEKTEERGGYTKTKGPKDKRNPNYA